MAKGSRMAVAAAIASAGALGIWSYAEFRRDVRAHRARVASGSVVVETGAGPVEVAETGHGPPVLVVHGTGGGFDQGMLLGEDLAARGFRVIAPSRFGYLRTPFPADASAEAQADQFAALLDVLGVERAAVLGVSAGANSSLQFAIRHPAHTSALVLLVPAAYRPRSPESMQRPIPPAERMLMRIVTSDFLFWLTMRFAEESAFRLVLATPPEDFRVADPHEQARARAVLRAILPISARSQGIRNDARLARNPPRYDLESIRAPALVVSVRNDLFRTFAAAQYTAQHIADARFLGYDRGGHLMLGHQREIMEETAMFVRRAVLAQ